MARKKKKRKPKNPRFTSLSTTSKDAQRVLAEQTCFYRTKIKLEIEQRASISRAYPRKTGINRELISSFKAYARKKKAYIRNVLELGKAPAFSLGYGPPACSPGPKRRENNTKSPFLFLFWTCARRYFEKIAPRAKKVQEACQAHTLHGWRPNLRQRDPNGRIVHTPPSVSSKKRCVRKKKKK